MTECIQCPDCKGLGKTNGETCKRCNGKLCIPVADKKESK